MSERHEIAELTGTSFTLVMTELGRSLSTIGRETFEMPCCLPDKLSGTLNKMLVDYPITKVVITDTTGTVTYSTDTRLIGSNFLRYDAFKKVLKNGKALCLDPVVCNSDPLGFYVASSIRDSKGSTIGSAGAFVDAARLKRNLPVNLHNGGARIVDANGSLVFQTYHPSRLMVGQDWSKFKFINASLKGHDSYETSFICPLSGKQEIAAEVPIHEFGWSAGSDIGAEQALGQIRSSVVNAVALSGIALLFALALAVMISRRIIVSLSSLVENARMVGEGNFETPIELRTGDELEDLAVSLDKARINLKRREEFGDALNNINTMVSSTLDIKEIMQRVVVDSTQAVGADIGIVFLRDGDSWALTYLYGLPDSARDIKFTKDTALILERTAQQGTPIIVENSLSKDNEKCEIARLYGVHSILTTPLRIRGEIFGILFFGKRSAFDEFSEAHVDFVAKLASSVSLAISNARMYATEHNIADTLQEALLALPDEIPGFDFGCLYRSATESLRVGGDFYDLFELPDRRLGILIGDVSGKGLEASALTSTVKNTIRAYSHEQLSPAEIIAKTNDLVSYSSPKSLFVTAFFGILDIDSRSLRYCSAGHPPAIIRRSEEEIEILPSRSPILGAFKEFEFNEDVVLLGANDMLILYTDGVIEARDRGEMFGEQRLAQTIRDAGNVNAKDMPDVILRGVTAYAGNDLSDDIAILTLAYKNISG